VVTVISTEPLAIAGSIQVGSHPSRVAFTPDGTKAYVTETGDGTVTVIDTTTRQVTKTIAVATPTTATLRDVAVSPDGKYAYVSDGANARIDQIDTSTDTLTATHVAVAAPGPYGLAFSPDGSQLWAGGAGGNAVSSFAYPALTPLATTAGAGSHMLGDRIVFRPDFSAAFVNSGSGCPCCGEFEKVVPGADAGTYVGSFNGGWAASGYALAMDPGGAIVYATSQATPVTCSAAGIPGSVWILDATTSSFSQLNQIPTYDEPRGLALSADGTLLLVAGYHTGGGSPGVQAYSTMLATPQGLPLAMPGLPQDIALQP
jgi:YVTN family beta-propeller protein